MTLPSLVRCGAVLAASMVACSVLIGCGGQSSTGSGDACQLALATSCATTGVPAGGSTAACPLQPQPQTTDSLATPVTLTSSADGLRAGDIKVGAGPAADTGNTVTVQYTGWTADGCIFDTSRKAGGSPFTFHLGAQEVIPGWDEGVRLMKVGGIRRLVIPPGLAYGASGRPPRIPGSATLTFDVELLSVNSTS